MVGVDRRLLQNVDWTLLVAALALVGMSAVTLGACTSDRAGGAVVVAPARVVRRGSGCAPAPVSSLDYRRIVRLAPALYVAGLAALVTVLVLGRTVSGARRWIGVGPFTVQPSETVQGRLRPHGGLGAHLARWPAASGLAALGLTLGVLAVPFVLIVKQPDLGTALVLVPVVLALLVGAGLPLRLVGRASGGRASR